MRDPRYTGSVKGGYWTYQGEWGAFTLGRPRDPAWMLRVGTKAAGNTLDGATIEQFPALPIIDLMSDSGPEGLPCGNPTPSVKGGTVAP